MKKKLKVYLIAIFILIGLSDVNASGKSVDTTGYLVGQLINDSSSQLSINNAAIQQNIFSSIPFLNGKTITSQNASLLSNEAGSFLLFNVNDTANTVQTIAVELYSNHSGNLLYQAHTGRLFYISKGYGNCTDCQFIRVHGRIAASKCASSSSPTASGNYSGCSYIIKILN